jgi:transglutaminase-like putative cysteine protease
MHLRVEHRFAFEYDAFISESFLELRVQPKTMPQQAVSAFELAIGPPTSVYRYRDWNDNLTHHFTITKFHNRIAVSTRSLVQTHRGGVAIASLTERAPRDGLPYTLNDFLEFGGPVTLTPGLRAAHRAIGLPATAPLGEQVLALGAYIAKRFEYRKNVTTYSSTTEDFLKIGAGVCQDFAHLMLGTSAAIYTSSGRRWSPRRATRGSSSTRRARAGCPSTRRTIARSMSATWS